MPALDTKRLATDEPSKLTVAEILATTASEYVKKNKPSEHIRQTLAKLSLCRTEALSHRRFACLDCGHEIILPNSCGDRHCPKCSGAKRSDWMDSTKQLLLHGVHHFQVVFTLPSEISSLALGNPSELYKLLFRASWASLKETIISEHNYDPAALMFLHTWNQRIQYHPHLHAVVPGAGPSLGDQGWVSTPKDWLVDADDLRRCYRKHFLDGLTELRKKGKLRLGGESANLILDDEWEAFVNKLKAKKWVTHIVPPPKTSTGENCDPEAIVKYLARYLTGGPISDARILAADKEKVTFLAREGVITGGTKKQVPVTLPTVEFVERWCLHILPFQFTKTRRFGGWSNIRVNSYHERCSIMLEALNAPLPEDAFCFPPPEEECDTDKTTCPNCGGRFVEFVQPHKPSWATLRASEYWPAWFSP